MICSFANWFLIFPQTFFIYAKILGIYQVTITMKNQEVISLHEMMENEYLGKLKLPDATLLLQKEIILQIKSYSQKLVSAAGYLAKVVFKIKRELDSKRALMESCI